ncbi:endosialidase [Blautia sp. An249]|uniref:endosialidase n=1 Tax=Blautia sp. An249 TaxID=1965603 RepID=UPI000B37BD59|nr:endosialidase [Blautia sp. An249]OUO74212.1 endosialidase [Blautia sp. An249]
MSVVKELIRTESNGTISFGNYELDVKSKLSDYEHQGDLYKVKTFSEITKLERNGMFVYESVPGTAVTELLQEDGGMTFQVEGPEDAQITVELEEDTEYEISLNDSSIGKMKTNLGGKLSFSVELENADRVSVKIVKL